MRYGTSHFVSYESAVAYYARQGIDAAGVQLKLREGEIHLGPPDVPNGGRFYVIGDEGRYGVEEVQP